MEQADGKAEVKTHLTSPKMLGCKSGWSKVREISSRKRSERLRR